MLLGVVFRGCSRREETSVCSDSNSSKSYTRGNLRKFTSVVPHAKSSFVNFRWHGLVSAGVAGSPAHVCAPLATV